MISKQDRIRVRTAEDLERKYNFERQFSKQQQQQQAKGEDGLTPYINANGNWWIGDVDTGVPAGTKVSFTPSATTGTEIGRITINDEETVLYAPEPTTGYDETSGEYFLKVGETTITETQLQSLLALL